MDQQGRQLVHWLVEALAQCEVGQGGRQLVHWLVEPVAQCEVGQGGRQVVHWLGEPVAQGEVGQGGRQVVQYGCTFGLQGGGSSGGAGCPLWLNLWPSVRWIKVGGSLSTGWLNRNLK